MVEISMKQVKNVSLSVAFLLFSVVAIIQPSTVYSSVGTSSSVGVVDYNRLIQQHPDTEKAQAAINAAFAQAKSEYDAKSVSMNEAEKQLLSEQLQQDIQGKKQELLVAINNKLIAAVKEVADAKKLTSVLDKSAVAYGGQDITDDVMNEIAGK